MYRGFTEIGKLWVRLGNATGRADVSTHGAQLLATAPKLIAAMHRSLNQTTVETGNPAAPRCLPTVADGHADRGLGSAPDENDCDQSTSFRSYPEMLYSGTLTWQQVDDGNSLFVIFSCRSLRWLFIDLALSNCAVYTDLALGNKSKPEAACCRLLTLGCAGYNNKQTTYTAYGMAYGLINADMIERYLLHWCERCLSSAGSLAGLSLGRL